MADTTLLAGPALRRLRKREGLTQANMASLLGISPSYLNLIERNQRPLSARVLVQVIERFDFDPRSLREDDNIGGLDGLVRREGALLQVVLPGEAHATPAAVVLVEPSQQTCAQRPAQAPVPPAHASLPGACAGAIGGASPHELPQPADGAAR
jgi:transcriptional regulator with XRE-family HTH domain